MSFISLQFLIFLPTVVFLYYSVPRKYRSILLLISSYYFYLSWNLNYGLILLISITTDYVAAQKIYQNKASLKRRWWLLLSLAVNLSLLGYFKYWNFAAESLNKITGPNLSLPILEIILPIGISFYTFQALSYTFDVYLNRRLPEGSYFRFSLYVMFFPQLVAGPIERSTELLPQLTSLPDASKIQFRNGLRLILFGFMKKLLVADHLATLVDTVYLSPSSFSAFVLVIAAYCFALQIYFDFSAYSDIARGSALLFGVELMRNFRCPYLACSIRDYWRRWHISLSTWFRDYIYFPLGGNQVGILYQLRNLLLVFVLSGLWHGANWTYLFWGVIHFSFLAIELLSSRVLATPWGAPIFGKEYAPSGILRWMRIFIVFNLISLAFVFFRSSSIDHAFEILGLITGGHRAVPLYRPPGHSLLSISSLSIMVIIAEFIESSRDSVRANDLFNSLPRFLRWFLYYISIFAILVYGAFDSGVPFIYFQF